MRSSPSAVDRQPAMTERLARACAGHAWVTLAAWLLVLLASVVALAFVLTGFSTEGEPTNDPQSGRADDRYARAFERSSEPAVTDVVVVRSEDATVADPRFRQFVVRLEGTIKAESPRITARSYYDTRSSRLISSDRHASAVLLSVPDDDLADGVIGEVERADAAEAFSVAVTGERTRNHDFNELSERDLQHGELQFGLPAALIVLLLVFGAVVAGVIPLVMAIFAIVAAMGLVALISQAFELSVFTVNMLTGMGLALGIDYSLFVISRYREERGYGRDPLGAISAAGATASRAVLFSGSAFVIAMFGMLLVPNTIMRSLAAGAILVGITSVAAALTLLPALLGLTRDRVDALRLPVVGRKSYERTNPEGRFWGAAVDRVLRRPALSLALAVGFLLLVAAPVLGMNIGAQGVATLPDDLASKRGFLALERSFPEETADPVHVLVAGASSPDVTPALAQLRVRLAADPRFAAPQVRRGSGGIADLVVPVHGDPTGDGTMAAVRDLREHLAPDAFAGTPADPLVGGTTSENIDYVDSVTDPAPLVIAFVLGLTFVLLTVAFRSIMVALTAVALNLLSVGAAYGLLVLVFQHGVGTGMLGFEHVETIEAWVPLFLFSVLFGLSLDYQVFLLSRVRERYDATADTRVAVRWGVASTARIITGAALIIIMVFSGFARGDLVMFQQMGFGVAAALLLDATIVRSVLLPSVMALLGERNWYLPRWLEWIPRLEVEGRAVKATPK